MAVNKHLFLCYASYQGDILVRARDALHWLSVRHLDIPEQCRDSLKTMMDDAASTVESLEPALQVTIGLVHGEHKRISECRDRYGKIQQQRRGVQERHRRLIAQVYALDMDFRSVYQYVQFADCLSQMAQRCEDCADTLTSMIAH